jgi:hypothetical protein
MAATGGRHPIAHRRRILLLTLVRCIAVTCACTLPLVASGDLIVPAGAQVNVNGGTILLACTDLSSAGTTNVGAGSLRNAADVTIQPAGVVNGGTGLIEVNGNWSNGGSFVAGAGTVDFRENCGGAPATISGNTTFSTVSFATLTGKNYFFAVGSTQTVTSLLQISGTAANPIQFHSTSTPQVAFLDLLGTGTQQIQNVGVTDVWATGQHLAANQANDGGGGNDQGWFGAVIAAGAAAIPTLGNFSLAALAVLLALVTALHERRRRAFPVRNT